MFGLVRADKQVRRLGGEIFQERKRRRNILFAILGIAAFIIFNIIMYSISTL